MIDLTWLSYFIAAVVVYYLGLFLLSLRPIRQSTEVGPSDALFVLLVPARNEEKVIEGTLGSLLGLQGANYLIILVNDGSTDATSLIAHRVASEAPQIIVVDRDPMTAGTGKSDVLNEGFRTLTYLIESKDPRVVGTDPERIIVGVLDADGRLPSDALTVVRPSFADPEVGSVQIAVEIGNAQSGVLARLQDMEFVAFSCFVQLARDRLGSSGLGGNGQFTRFSALDSLGRSPWDRHSLTEDLDLGLRLVNAGWKTKFCGLTAVSQQGLTRLRPLFRQRTRWIQGHYQCWKHLPALARSPTSRWYTRLDLIVYLVLIVTVTLVFADLVLGLLGTLGVLDVQNRFLDFLTPNRQRYVQAVLAVTPIAIFLYTYQRRSRHPMKWWELPAFGAVFTVYSYFWVLATARAWARMCTGRWAWVKTPRVST